MSSNDEIVKGEGLTFYSFDEVKIAYNEGKADLNASIKVRATDLNDNNELETKLIETTVGRVLFNEVVPENAGYFNVVLSKISSLTLIGALSPTSTRTILPNLLASIAS